MASRIKKGFLWLCVMLCATVSGGRVDGGHCVQQFRGHYRAYHHVKAVQVVAAPYYLVGQPIRDEAYDTKLLDKARQAFKADLAELKEALNLRFRGEGRIVFEGEAAAGGDVAVGDAAGGGTMPEAAALGITRNCVSCHGPQKKDAGLDLTKAITDSRIASEIGTRVVSDDPEWMMPPQGFPKGADGNQTPEAAADRQALFDYSTTVSKSIRRSTP